MIHYSIAHVTESRLGKPCHGFFITSNQTQVHTAIERHNGKLMSVWLCPCHTHVIISQGTLYVFLVIIFLFLSLEIEIIILWQNIIYHIDIFILLGKIILPQTLDVAVISHFTINVNKGYVILS